MLVFSDWDLNKELQTAACREEAGPQTRVSRGPKKIGAFKLFPWMEEGRGHHPQQARSRESRG